MAEKQSPQDPDEFVSPLENYDPKTYDDPLERALAEEHVSAIQNQPFASVPPEMTIAEAVAKLAQQQVACLLVEDEGRLVGVFSDRDVSNRVALEYDEVKDKPVRELMTTEPVFVYESDCAAAALSVMAVSGFRHVPVTNLQEKVVGIVSPQRVTKFLRDHMQVS